METEYYICMFKFENKHIERKIERITWEGTVGTTSRAISTQITVKFILISHVYIKLI